MFADLVPFGAENVQAPAFRVTAAVCDAGLTTYESAVHCTRHVERAISSEGMLMHIIVHVAR